MKTLRDDQAEVIANIRGAMQRGTRRVVASGPTGVGKTVIMSDLVSKAQAKDKRVLMNTCGIYGILNKTNGKFYVGSSINIQKRWRMHRNSLNRGNHRSIKLQRAWWKYGDRSFEFLILENCCVVKEELISREQSWIDRLDAFTDGYNSTPLSSSSLGIKRSTETKVKLSEIVKNHARDPAVRLRLSEQARNYMASPENRKKNGYAIKAAYAEMTDEEKAALRAIRLKAMGRPDVREKLRASAIGRRPTIEARVNMSLAQKGRIQTEATKAKRRAALMGHSTSMETREKIRQANLGRIVPEVEKEKMRAAWRRRKQCESDAQVSS